MNIIHVFPAIRTAGGTTLLKNNLVNLFQKTTNEVWASGIEEDIKFYKVKCQITKHTDIKNFIKIFIKLLKRNNKESLIHIHGRSGFLVFIAAKMQKFKTIYQAHGYYNKLINKRKYNYFHNLIDSSLLKFSDYIIFTSDGERDFVLRNFHLKTKYKVIYNRSSYNHSQISKKISRKKKHIIYCLATSNIYQKGIDRQLLLIKELLKFTKNFKLIHYFNFQNKKELEFLKKEIKKLGLSDYYIFKKAKKNIWSYIYKQSSTIISTSRFEGRNLVIQEAFHNNISVVATNCLGQNELLNKDRSFILDEDKKDWAKVLFKAISSEELRTKRAKKAKKWIRQFGDMKTYTEELLETYKFVLGK